MKQEAYLLATKAIEHILNYQYHQSHKVQAKRILQSIESVKGKTDPKLIKLSNEYALDVLGWSGYAPWLYVYSAIAQSFKEGWIPDNYYGKVVVPTMKGSYGKVSDLKPLTKKIFNNNVFPDIAYYVNGLFFSSSNEILREDCVEDFLFKDSEVVVFKLDDSIQGKGVYVLKKSSFSLSEVTVLGNGVFQEYIEQHQFFEKLMPASVATLRITTVLNDKGDASVRAVYLRVGRSKDTHVKSASHIRVPVELKSGELEAKGYLPNWVTIDKHPDTHFVFSNKTIPSFQKCIATALELHQSLPHVRSIGWDMIVDKNNRIKVMEWNGNHNDIKFSEATQGPCFSDLGWEKIWCHLKPSML